MVVVVTSSERTPFARMSGGILSTTFQSVTPSATPAGVSRRNFKQ
jgi:hypothetical protein